LFPSGYPGINIDTQAFDYRAAFTTLYSYSTALFPLFWFIKWGHYNNLGFADGIIGFFSPANIIKFLNSGGLTGLLYAIVAGFAFFLILWKNKTLKLRTVLGITIISTVACFVVNIPHALTSQSQVFVSRGAYGFTSSFFSYFWIICILSVLALFLHKRLKFKKTIMLFFSVLVFLVTICTNYTNAVVIESITKATVRRTMFDRLTSSHYFDCIEDGAVIYVEGYYGIHQSISNLAQVSRPKTGNNHIFTGDYSDIEKYEHAYYIKYDPDSELTLVARINEDMTGGEVFVLPYKDMDTASLIFTKSPELSSVFVNGSNHGYYNGTAIIPIPIKANRGAWIEADGINLQSVRVLRGSVADNSADILTIIDDYTRVFDASNGFDNMLRYGWSGVEDWGVWSDRNTDYNPILGFSVREKDDLTLSMTISVFPDPMYFAVYINGEMAENYIISGETELSIEIRKELLLEEVNGAFPIVVEFNIENPISPYALGLSGDTRVLGIGLIRFTVNQG